MKNRNRKKKKIRLIELKKRRCPECKQSGYLRDVIDITKKYLYCSFCGWRSNDRF
jgi:ribosomal protein L37AE/L43A